jgi:hypothetical protein
VLLKKRQGFRISEEHGLPAQQVDGLREGPKPVFPNDEVCMLERDAHGRLRRLNNPNTMLFEG